MKNKKVIRGTMIALVFLTLISWVIPIVGPSIISYFSGKNAYRNRRLYGLKAQYIIAAITLGNVIALAIVGLIILNGIKIEIDFIMKMTSLFFIILSLLFPFITYVLGECSSPPGSKK
jgi:hypothetical protein